MIRHPVLTSSLNNPLHQNCSFCGLRATLHVLEHGAIGCPTLDLVFLVQPHYLQSTRLSTASDYNSKHPVETPFEGHGLTLRSSDSGILVRYRARG
jgi:hypothetical protein